MAAAHAAPYGVPHGYATNSGIPTTGTSMNVQTPAPATPPADTPTPATEAPPGSAQQAQEIGGPRGPEPTRYGDWERKGRCIDF